MIVKVNFCIIDPRWDPPEHFNDIGIQNRHTEEMERLRSDYEVLLELAVKEKENEMRNTIIENEELEDLAAQVCSLAWSVEY